MRVNHIRVVNILGISELELTPGSVTEVTGANATGKTSLLDAIRCALSGGTDATLLRQGSERGEVVLVLDDGTEIRKEITRDASTTTVKHPEYGKISKPAHFLKKLADLLSLNPIAFLTAPTKDRVNILLEAIPMHVTADQLREVPTIALEGIDLDKHALEVIGKIGRAIYDLRTGVNRAEKEKRATANQVSETLPADAPEGDWSEILRQTSEELSSMAAVARRHIATINKEAAEFKEGARSHFEMKKDGILAELEQAIEKLRMDSQLEMERCEKDRDAEIEKIEATKAECLQAEERDYRPREAELKEKLGQAKAMVEQHTKAETTRQFIAQLGDEANKLESEATKLTHALDRLEILKASLLEKLPIEGLEVRDGDLFVGGLPWERVNESKRIRLAIEIAKLRAGGLGLVAVDGLERLDPKTFATFKKEASKSGLQFVISRVTSDEQLTVRTEGKAVNQ